MTRELYTEDAYLKEFTARVVKNSGREVILDRTAFYPGGAGMPHDQGELNVGPVRVKVIEVRRAEAEADDDFTDDLDDSDGDSDGSVAGGEPEIIHVLDHALPKTVREVNATLDWTRRHRNMRYNTALALLASALERDLGATMTGGRIRASRARLDFENPKSPPDDAIIKAIENETNGVISNGDGIDSGGPPKKPPEPVEGGLHVRDIAEVGGIEVVRWMDRGSRGFRLEFVV